MSEQTKHDLTLDLLEAVGAELDPDERDELFAARALIVELLTLGPTPAPEQIAEWIRDANHH